MNTSAPMTPNFGPPEKTHIRLGFVALSDAAPLAAASLLDLGARHGITLELCRQPSWAAVRDKLLSGEIDAAHALYGLVYGVQLGHRRSASRHGRADGAQPQRPGDHAVEPSRRCARRNRQPEGRVASLGRTPVFAQTFPTGTHAMWLYYWLAAQGVHPLRDIESVVIPPPQMVDALAEDKLDGCCCR